MNDIQPQNESSNPSTPDLKRLEKEFYYNENFKIENWDSLTQENFHTITTNNNVKFKFVIRKVSSNAVKFKILKEAILKHCLVTIEIKLSINNSKKKISQQIQHKFSTDSRLSEISVDFSELCGTNNTSNRNLLINLTIDHHHSQNPSNSPNTSDNINLKSTASSELYKSLAEPRNRPRNMGDSFARPVDKYCGIRNQGSTCYMNSILQAFFHIPIFRRLIFQIDINPDSDRESNAIFNLRQLFAQMSNPDNDSVSTRQLTNSFGWKDDEVVDREQDPLEFYGKILNLLKDKLKDTRFKNEIDRIFYGKMRYYRRCINVNFSEINTETFNNITLETKNFKNFEDSLFDNIEPELSTGDNRYQTKDFGPQEVEIGSEFLEFPLVLYIHLNRFFFDKKKCKVVLNNSRFEFPSSIDFAPYLAEDSPQKSEDMIYDLFGVIAHAGEITSGHFYAFLRTDPKEDIDKWYKFNDSHVLFSNKKEAIIDNFGGRKNEEKQHYSAYILIYMRRNELENLFCPAETNIISGFVLDDAENKKNYDESMPIELYTINHIDPESFRFVKPTLIDIPLNSNFENLYKIVSKRVQMEDIQLYYCYKNSIFGEIEYTNEYNVGSLISSSFFVDKFNGIKNDILVFIEFYSPDFEWPKIRLLRSVSVYYHQKIISILPLVESMVHFEKSDDEEIPFLAFVYNNNSIKEVSIESEFIQCIASNGSFIIFQMVPSNETIKEKKRIEIDDVSNFYINNSDLSIRYFDYFENELPIVVDEYFKLVDSSINLTVCNVFYVDKGAIIDHNYNIKTLSIPGLFDFQSLMKFIIKLYDIEFDDSNQFFYIYKDSSVSPIDMDTKMIKDCLGNNNKLHVLITNDIDSIARVEYTFSENPLEESTKITSFFNKNLVASSLFGLQKKFSENSDHCRLIRINKEKESIKNIIDNDSLLLDLKNPIRIEVIPEDQRKIAKNEFLIKCRKVSLIDDKFHSQKPISMPFLIKIIEKEPFRQTKERIEKCIDEKNRYRVKYILDNKGQDEIQLSNNDILFDLVDDSSQIIIVFPYLNAHKIGDTDGLTIF